MARGQLTGILNLNNIQHAIIDLDWLKYKLSSLDVEKFLQAPLRFQ